MKQLSLFLAFAKLTTALSSTLDAAPDVNSFVQATGGKNVTSISPDELHERILSAMDADRIVHSDNLYDYFTDNHDSNHTIYVNDTRAFIDMSQVTVQLDKRQTANPCFGYTKHWAEQVQHWWGDWHPASGCLYTGNDKAGGSHNIGWSFSLSISENAGVSWNIIKDVLSVAAQITVTQTWSHSGSITCNVPGNSVGQVWIQNALVWGWMWSEGCQSCGFGGGCGGRFGYNAKADGGALAPAESATGGQGANYGCSTGYNKVKC